MSGNKISALFIIILLLPARLLAQQPSTTPRVTGVPVTAPAAYTNMVLNYVRVWEPSMPTADPDAVEQANDIKKVKQTTQFFDGLGRLIQTVSKGVSISGKDLVSPVVYDSLGREQFKYLPYIPQSDSSSDGRFKNNPFVRQQQFYQNKTLMPGVDGESVYYSRIDYEASPLNRVMKTYAPGNSWAKNDLSTVERGGNHPVENQYMVNTAADSVRLWDLSATGLIPTSDSIYRPGTLYKNILIDEAGNQIVEFKDREGKILLKKVQLVTTPGAAHAGWLCTYYTYDDMGNLRFVIPPRAVEAIWSNWIISNAIAAELCFIYRYDGRGRMTIKKVPGADSTEMVYDRRDRLVFSRDGNMRWQNNWMTTFYDDANRPVMTALYKAPGSTRSSLQTTMNTAAAATQSIPYTLPGVADLALNAYDGKPLYEATNSIVLQDGFDTGTGAETVLQINTSLKGGVITVAATNPLPNIPPAALTPLSYTFYDNYSYLGKLNYDNSDIAKVQAGSNPYPEPLPAVESNMTKGRVTGGKVYVMGVNQWLTTSTYYNDKGRVIQTLSDNLGGGKDVSNTLYDFNGKVLSTYLRHKNPRSAGTPQITLLTMLHYDAAGRMDSVKKRINDQDSLLRTIALNSYDELGRLNSKRLGVNAGAEMETLSYEYNIRGWLKGINKGYVNTSNSSSNWFGEDLNYDYGFTANQFNGNIAGAKWKTPSSGIARAYGYSYDKANRLTVADFYQNTSGTVWDRNVIDFSVSNLTYDANGNIRSMTQKGMIGTSSSVIDQLSYTYAANSNKLTTVSDPTNTTSEKLGDFIDGNKTGADYRYDTVGNLIQDLNKSINSITYNHLSLPDSILITGKGKVSYLYDATGRKLRKTVTDNTGSQPKVTTTDYINEMVYSNDTLQFINHEEGRIRTVMSTGKPVGYAYDYFIKDHLGNVRMVLTEQKNLSIYTASMEPAKAPVETALFSNVTETRVNKPVGYPSDNTTGQNEFVAKLNARSDGKKIGPSLVLRVMAGDTVQIGAKAFYKSAGPQNENASLVPAEAMLADLLQTFSSGIQSGSDHGATSADAQTPFNSNFYNNDYQRLKDKDPDKQRTDKPKAYLNFVLFDDEFKLVEQNSGVKQVKGEPDQLQTLAQDKMAITKTGFLYVYTSNESTQDVFFDDVTVMDIPSPLLEETHYYPFGLTMAGISSNALKGANYAENKYKFNKGSELQSKEFSDGAGLELYATPLRSLDPQLGRWWQIDSKPDYAQSVYSAMSNNPILLNDPLGDSSVIPWSAKASQSPVNLLKPLGTGNSIVKNGANEENKATIRTNNSGTIGKDVSTTVKQTGDDGRPLIGNTTTHKVVTKEATLSSGILGDKFTYAHSGGMVSGKDGRIFSTDLSTNKGAPDGASMTLFSTVTLGASTDLSLSAGVSVLGYEAHLSIGVGVGLGQIGGGASHTDENNFVSGGDLTLRPGLGTLGAIFLVPKFVF